MANFTIPNRPVGGDIRRIADIEADFDTVTGYCDSLASHRKLLGEAHAGLSGTVGAATFFLRKDGSLIQSGGTAATAIQWWHIPTSLLGISGKTVSPILRFAIFTNDVPIGNITVTAKLSAFTVSGSNVNLATVGVAAVTATGITNPLANTSYVTEGVAGSMPADGPYAPTITFSAGNAVNSGFYAAVQLFEALT